MALPEPQTIEPPPAETAPALRDPPQRWWLLALLFTAMLISYVHRSALSVAAPFISIELNLSKAEMGFCFHLSFGFTRSCKCPPVGCWLEACSLTGC